MKDLFSRRAAAGLASSRVHPPGLRPARGPRHRRGGPAVLQRGGDGPGALRGDRNLPPDAVRINANENPMGPCPEAIEAIQKVVPLGGRYLYNETFAFADAMAAIGGPVAGSRHAVRRLERPAPPGRPGLHRPREELRRRRSRLRGRRASRHVRRGQDHQGPAPQGLVPRRPRDGRGRPQRRRHLRLQPQQPDRLAHAQGRDRVPRRQQAEGRDRPPGRGVHPPVEDGRARLVAWSPPART